MSLQEASLYLYFYLCNFQNLTAFFNPYDFFIPSSLIPGKGTARRKLPFQPTHSWWKEALAGTELSQKRDSRRSCSLLLSFARPLLDALHPHATCYVQLKDWHWLPVRAQTGLSASGGDPKSGRKMCLKEKAEKTLDCSL